MPSWKTLAALREVGTKQMHVWHLSSFNSKAVHEIVEKPFYFCTLQTYTLEFRTQWEPIVLKHLKSFTVQHVNMMFLQRTCILRYCARLDSFLHELMLACSWKEQAITTIGSWREQVTCNHWVMKGTRWLKTWCFCKVPQELLSQDIVLDLIPSWTNATMNQATTTIGSWREQATMTIGSRRGS